MSGPERDDGELVQDDLLSSLSGAEDHPADGPVITV